MEETVIHIADVKADPNYTWTKTQQLGGFRTMLGVPIVRKGAPVGVMGLARKEVRPFTEKQIEPVSTFADRTAIAIENERLLSELRESYRVVQQRAGKLEGSRRNSARARTARRRSSRRDQTHEQVAPFPSSAGGRFDCGIWFGKAA